MASMLPLRRQAALSSSRRFVSRSPSLSISHLPPHRPHSPSFPASPSTSSSSTIAISRNIPALRAYSSAAAAAAPATAQSTADAPRTDVTDVKLSPRWLSETKARVGKCIMFGLDPAQVRRAGEIMKTLASEWKELSAGSEGYLTGEGREGLGGQRVGWGEMDTMGHVNNVTYVRYAESALINWVHNFAVHIDPENHEAWSELWTSKSEGLIIKSIKMDYKFPMTYPDRVFVYHKLRHAHDRDTDTLFLEVVILSEKHQRPAARCKEEIVMYNYQAAKKMNIRPFMTNAFKETFKLQEEAKRVNTERILNILREVEALEKESWDRSDAKEDFGSAK